MSDNGGLFVFEMYKGIFDFKCLVEGFMIVYVLSYFLMRV